MHQLPLGQTSEVVVGTTVIEDAISQLGYL